MCEKPALPPLPPGEGWGEGLPSDVTGRIIGRTNNPALNLSFSQGEKGPDVPFFTQVLERFASFMATQRHNKLRVASLENYPEPVHMDA